MLSSQKLVSTIFESSEVTINYDSKSDYFSVIAKEDLPAGHLVLIEHVFFSNDKFILCKAVQKDPKLFETLYPRTSTNTTNKAFSNMFVFDNIFVIGDSISKFNHSCIPNCHIDIIETVIVDVKYNVKSKFCGIWTISDVKKGDELSIDYVNIGSKDYHDKMKQLHHFSCNCTDEYISENDQRGNDHAKMTSQFCQRDKEIITRLIDGYLETSQSIDINVDQHHLRYSKVNVVSKKTKKTFKKKQSFMKRN